MDSPNISLHYIKRLFRHLDKTLAKLNYPLPLYMQCLLLLHNLKEIRIPIEGVKRGFKEFLQRNPQVYHVQVYSNAKSICTYEDMVTLAEAQHLRWLMIEGSGQLFSEMLHMPIFYNISSLELRLENFPCQFYPWILEHLGPQLKWLYLHDIKEDDTIDIDLLDHISHLECLEEFYCTYYLRGDDDEIVDRVCQFKMLTYLVIVVDSPKATLQIIRLLDKLTEMENELVDNDEFEIELSEMLKESGRKLKYNNKMFPAAV